MASTPSRFSARFLLALAFSLTLACFAGCSGGQDLAAKCSAFTISEQEVTDYTASSRAQNGYTDDTDWARFLVAQGYSDTKTWREEAIRALAEQKIVENRAAELNVSADETVVDQTIAYVRQLRGITTDEEWASYLEGIGMTADEYRASCEFASVEQQVLAADLDLAANGSDDELNAYIKSNLMDRVTRRFSVITFKSEADANAALAQLEGLSGDELAARFTGSRPSTAPTARPSPTSDGTSTTPPTPPSTATTRSSSRRATSTRRSWPATASGRSTSAPADSRSSPA